MENDEFLDDYLNEDVIEEEDSTFEDPILNSEEESEQYNQPQEEVDILSTLLQDKGISDPSRIQIENENGEKELVDFRDLPVEEQLEILRQDDDELDDDEVNVINYLRANNLKFEDVINYAKSQGINEYLANQPSNVEIDSLTDDEVFLTDLLTRIPDITDEEAQIALETEKQNPDLYNKKVQALRDDLNEKEAIRLQEENQAFGLMQRQLFEEFKRNIVNNSYAIRDIAGKIELDNNDINDTINFLLAEDNTGTRYIAKALNDPKALLKMAWFYLKGEEAISYMADYYENQIKEHSKHNYYLGYEDGKYGKQPEKGTRVVRRTTNSRASFLAPENPALKS